MLATKEGEWLLNLAIVRRHHQGFKLEKYLQGIAPDIAAKHLSNVRFVLALSGRGIAPMDETTFHRFKNLDTSVLDVIISQKQTSEKGLEYLVCKSEKLTSATDFINAYGLFPEAIILGVTRGIGTKENPRGMNLAEQIIHDYISNRCNFLNHPMAKRQSNFSRLKRRGSHVLGIVIACLVVINTIFHYERNSIHEANIKLANRVNLNRETEMQTILMDESYRAKSNVAQCISDIINTVPSLNLYRLNFHPMNEKSFYRGWDLSIGESIRMAGYCTSVSEIVNMRNQLQRIDWVLTCEINTLERSDDNRLSYQITINE